MKLSLKSDDAEGGIIPGIRTPIVIDGKPMASPNTAPKLGQSSLRVAPRRATSRPVSKGCVAVR